MCPRKLYGNTEIVPISTYGLDIVIVFCLVDNLEACQEILKKQLLFIKPDSTDVSLSSVLNSHAFCMIS